MLQLRPFGGELRSACEAISGLSLTTANYHEVIATLNKRFGSKQQVVNKHMDVLLRVEAVTAAQNVEVCAICLVMPAPTYVVCNH